MPMTWFFLSPTIQGLQFLIDEIYFDFNKLGLEINTNKTVFMVFTNNKKVNGKSFKFHFDNILLKRVFNFKYLGIIMHPRPPWRHIGIDG